MGGSSDRGACAPAAAPWRRSAPALLLAALVVLLPVQFETGGPIARFAPTDLLVAAYLAVRLPRLRYVPAAWGTWVLPLAAVIVVGMPVALIRTGVLLQYAVVQKGIGLAVLLALFACVVDFCRDWERVRWVMGVYVAGVTANAGVAVVAALLVNLGLPTLPLVNEPFPGFRLSGLLIDPNAFGGVIGVALLLHAVTAMNGAPLLGRRWTLLAGAVLPLALLMTFSRSAWLGVTAGILTLFAVRPVLAGRMAARLAAPLLLLLPVVGAALFLLIPGALQLVARPSEVASRVSIGADAFAEVLHNPLFGMGLGAYLQKYDIIIHNTPLWILTEFGVIGLLVFGGFVLSFAAKLLAAARTGPPDRRPVLLALLAAHAVMLGVSMGIEALYQRPWWLVLALAGSAYAVTRAGPEVQSLPAAQSVPAVHPGAPR